MSPDADGLQELVIEVPERPADPACSVIRLELAGEVEPTPFLVHPSRDGVITLTPHDATLTGPSIRLEREGVIGDVRHNIGYWVDASSWVGWPIAVGATQTGRYRVDADIACADASAGARVQVQVEAGQHGPEVTVPGTGGWQSYRTLPLGEVVLAPGAGQISLRALSKPGEAVVNVRAIRLTPLGK